LQGAEGNRSDGAIPRWLARRSLRVPLHATSSAGSHANRLTTRPSEMGRFPAQHRNCSQKGLALGRGPLSIGRLGRPNPKRSATDQVTEQHVDPLGQHHGSAQTGSMDSIISGHTHPLWTRISSMDRHECQTNPSRTQPSESLRKAVAI
jgi:hypothetical protein